MRKPGTGASGAQNGTSDSRAALKARLAAIQEKAEAGMMARQQQTERILGEREAELAGPPMSPQEVAETLGGTVVGTFHKTPEGRWVNQDTGVMYDTLPPGAVG